MSAAEPDVTLHVGKHGITDTLVQELRAQVKKRGRVKVRMHRTAQESLARHEEFARLGERAGVRLEKVVGFVAIFSRS